VGGWFIPEVWRKAKFLALYGIETRFLDLDAQAKGRISDPDRRWYPDNYKYTWGTFVKIIKA
jgi:hypothetical protein